LQAKIQKAPILDKFTKKEIKKKVRKEDKEIREKVFLLANGLIELHGYDREEAFEKALDIARNWRDQGGSYTR
jgi:hypothetical protein